MLAKRDFQDNYVQRIIDNQIDELLPALPAILLDGPKAVGKTATATRRAGTVRRLDQDRGHLGPVENIEHGPSVLVVLYAPVAFAQVGDK